MSWEEPVDQQYIIRESCTCIAIAACCFGRDWSKTWMLASTFSGLEQLACSCPHPAGTHQQIAGAVTSTGQFMSRQTAKYPEQLANAFARLIIPPIILKWIFRLLPRIYLSSRLMHCHLPGRMAEACSPKQTGVAIIDFQIHFKFYGFLFLCHHGSTFRPSDYACVFRTCGCSSVHSSTSGSFQDFCG